MTVMSWQTWTSVAPESSHGPSTEPACLHKLLDGRWKPRAGVPGPEAAS